eukprot:Hpha_TRINITY_DN15248_c0_g1::TRINITY_DN15248_c0_g1_i1::g.67783::m.67783
MTRIENEGDPQKSPLLPQGGEGQGKLLIFKAVHLSFCFFLVFTAFSAIQNLEASIVAAHCKDCDVYCSRDSPNCTDTGFDPGDVDDSSVECSWFHPTSGLKYCANNGGDCKNACPNDDDGVKLNVWDGNETFKAPDFEACSTGANVGSVAIGLLYATFTVCCLIGPYVVDVIKPKWSISVAFINFSIFCCANMLVSKFPKSVELQWGVLVPASALVGFSASFLWTAQGTYLTIIAIQYATVTGMESQTAALGLFNGIFWGFFQFTQITGNLAESLLLNQAGWSNTSLMLLYLVSAGSGLTLSLFLQNVSDDEVTDDHESPSGNGSGRHSRASTAASVSRQSTYSGVMGPQAGTGNAKTHTTDHVQKTFLQSVKGVVTIWGDRRMLCLIPLIMYSGLEMGFIWGDFTSNWVKPSVGTNNIGYVMAAFGASDVLFSALLGKVSDSIGRFPVVLLGSTAQLATLVTLYKVDVGGCDHKWTLLIISACAWGIGDAAYNTQIGALLGEYFEDRKEDAFSNLKLWQSLMTAIAFFLNLKDGLMSSDATLIMVLVMCCISTVSFSAGAFLEWRRQKEKRAYDSESEEA